MKALTVSELHRECAKLMGMGMGDRQILITSDDECNEFHMLFSGFANVDGHSIAYGLPDSVGPDDVGKDYVVLGLL